jgi:hypothetical protein
MAKKTITLNARLKWPDVQDDYVVWHDDHAIGRIRLVADPKAASAAWEWSVNRALGNACMGQWDGRKSRRLHEEF